MKSKTADTDGTIIEFMQGSHSYDGIWFGEPHPILKGQFWWRTILREYLSSGKFHHPVPDEAGEVYSRKQLEDAHIVGYTKGRLAEQDSDSIYQDAVNYAATISPAPPSGEDAGKGWISVEKENMPLETDLIVKHPFGVEAIHFFNAEWTFWYTGKSCGSDLIKSITHWKKP